MKKLVKLIRLSSKEAFKKLRNLGEIECYVIQKPFTVTNLFLRHISGGSKNRKLRDIIERLSSINLIEKISKRGTLTEKRNFPKIEGYIYKTSYRINLNIGKIDFFMILGERTTGEIVLISVFLNFLE